MKVQEIDFITGEDYEVRARYEKCVECQWPWIHVDFWLDTRGPGFHHDKEEIEEMNPERFKHLSFDSFQIEITKLINEIREAVSRRDFKRFFQIKNKIWPLMDAWNQKANDVWDQVDKEYQDEYEKEHEEPYWWVKIEKEKRQKIREIQRRNFKIREQFFDKLFEDYPGEEFNFEEKRWEVRLIENIEVFERERCDNNQDDNDDGKKDCEDDQCGGKECGEMAGIPMYCINNECKVKETDQAVCGNGICEPGEGDLFMPVPHKKRKTEEEIGSEIVEGRDGTVETIETDMVMPEETQEEQVVTGNVITGYVVDDELTCPQIAISKWCPDEKTLCPMKSDDKGCSDWDCDACVVEEDIDNIDEQEETDEELEDTIEEIIESIEEDVEEDEGIYEVKPCPEDCKICPEPPKMKCPEDEKAVSKGNDNHGCSLGNTCVKIEKETCKTDEDCPQKLCANVECLRKKPEDEVGMCKVTKLKECEEEECIPGDEKIKRCDTGEELIVEICEEGLWVETGVGCDGGEEIIEETEEGFGDECKTIGDCGEDYVCSRGWCELLIVEEEPEIEQEEEEIEELVEAIEVDEEMIKEYEEEQKEDYEEGKEGNEGEFREEKPMREEERHEEPREEFKDEGSNVISNFFLGFLKRGTITGAFITGFNVEEGEGPPLEEPPHEEPPPEEDEEHDWEEEEERRKEEERERQREERRQRERECKDWSAEECKRRYVEPCVGPCVFKEDGTEGELEECQEICEEEKKSEIEKCVDRCFETCEKDEWCEIKWEEHEHKEEKGVFTIGGQCRSSEQKTEAFIYFGGWGEPFEKIHELKHKYHQQGHFDWCKWELENALKQRKEIEKSFNQEFIIWFFEDYMSNSAEDWEKHISGIFELYWSGIVENQRQIWRSMECLGIKDIEELMKPEILSFNYSSEYGNFEYWEKLEYVRMHDKPEKSKKIKIITPYMRLSFFPPKEVLKIEMKKAMEEGRFPGPPEERDEEQGPSEEEKDEMRRDKGFMKKIKKISDKYGGSFDVSVQLMDYNTGEVIFNIYGEINERDIIDMEPMLPEKVPEKDATVTVDFDKVFEFIKTSEKDMKDTHTEAPEWATIEEKPVEKIKNFIDGIKMFFKIRDLIASAQVEPKEAAGDINSLAMSFFKMMMSKDRDKGPPPEDITEEEKEKLKEIQKEIFGSKPMITGKVFAK